jgi:Tfp pilus tip-associated adhesin PilY1
VTSTVADAACVTQAPDASNNFIKLECTPSPAKRIQISTIVSTYTESLSGGIVVSTTPVTTSSSSYANFDSVCYTQGTEPPLPTANPTPPSGCSAWPCSETTAVTGGGSLNSLADVAQYYYINDLRTDPADPFSPNSTLGGAATTTMIIGPGTTEQDRVLWQHMTTFGMGIGVSGTVRYTDTYQATGGSVDFEQIRAGTKDWPVWPVATPGFYTSGAAYNDPRAIDDFWHASVNGRGRYFNADNQDQVGKSVEALFAAIDAKDGAGGGLSVSNNIPVPGDNFAYITSFRSVDWSGDLTSNEIVSGVVQTGSPTWSANANLAAKTGLACDNRKIYYRNNTTGTLKNFSWNTQACDATGAPSGAANTELTTLEQAYFSEANAVQNLSHYLSMTDGLSLTVNQRSAAAGANLVNFVRGQRGLTGFAPNSLTKLYRDRQGVLGDIVGSVAVVVKAPKAEYADAGYSAFVSSNSLRTTTIYVGANDGMLHAFSATTGEEKWAYVPRAVIPNLFRLADKNYDVNHRFFVDGSPVVGDIKDGANWKTILVGGLNKGGKGYYALDITNPASPVSLWEFGQSAACGGAGDTADCDVGLSFGKPVITKLASGAWVVLVTSGYNNTIDGGTGNGALYVLNAATGAIISKLATGVGDAATPSGLRELNNYVANPRLDNTTLRVYGGDLLGNVWRFDINDTIAPSGKEATLVATAKDPSGVAQPITTRVQLAEVDGKTFIVAATGQLLGFPDTQTTQVQTVYGFKDTVGAASPVYANLRSSASIKNITLTRTASRGTTSCSGTSSCVITDGWFIDLPEERERVNVDPVILAGTLIFATNTPIEVSNASCESGHSWLNAIGLVDGVGKVGGGAASNRSFNQLSVGLNYLIPKNEFGSDGTGTEGTGGSGGSGNNDVGCPPGQIKVVSTGDARGLDYVCVEVGSSSPLGRRVSWREIVKSK